MIKRQLEGQILDRVGTGKVILLFGARQLGKTTLLKTLFGREKNVLWFNGDEPDVRALFENVTSARLKSLFSGHQMIIFDEAQRIRDIGVKLKLAFDNIPGVQIIATGSSSFELANETQESLTGRKWEFRLYPLSFEEMAGHHGVIEERRQLHTRLLYGYYPEIVKHPGEEKDRLKLLTDSFLYKDISHWENIQKPEKLIRLLQAIAFQLGNQVSYSELAVTVGLDHKTVEKYLNLLEQTFVIYRLGPLSRNLRNELKSTRKIYFYDNGIRNALVAAFQPVELRQDIGALWENWLLSERMKYLHYHNVWANPYFWRTAQQQEIDYVEEKDGAFFAYDFKWRKARMKFPKSFTDAYQPALEMVVTPENFQQFIGLE